MCVVWCILGTTESEVGNWQAKAVDNEEARGKAEGCLTHGKIICPFLYDTEPGETEDFVLL